MNDQWELLRGAGMARGFTGTWIESGDTDAVTTLLGADLTSRQDCDPPRPCTPDPGSLSPNTTDGSAWRPTSSSPDA